MKRKKRNTDGEIDLKLESDENENAEGVKALRHERDILVFPLQIYLIVDSE